jgi:hypothetical protein
MITSLPRPVIVNQPSGSRPDPHGRSWRGGEAAVDEATEGVVRPPALTQVAGAQFGRNASGRLGDAHDFTSAAWITTSWIY